MLLLFYCSSIALLLHLVSRKKKKKKMPSMFRSHLPGSEKDQNKSQNKKDIQKKRTLDIQNKNQKSEAPKGKKQKFCNAPSLAPEQHKSVPNSLSNDEKAPTPKDKKIAKT